jgi:hypothetical protein
MPDIEYSKYFAVILSSYGVCIFLTVQCILLYYSGKALYDCIELKLKSSREKTRKLPTVVEATELIEINKATLIGVYLTSVFAILSSLVPAVVGHIWYPEYTYLRIIDILSYLAVIVNLGCLFFAHSLNLATKMQDKELDYIAQTRRDKITKRKPLP